MTAEDLTDQTFEKIYGKFDPAGHNQHAQQGFIFRAASQVLLDHLRHPYVKREQSLDAVTNEYDQHSMYEEIGYRTIEGQDNLASLLAVMKPQEQTAVVLNIIEARPAPEVAEKMNVSRAKVYRLIRAGLDRAHDSIIAEDQDCPATTSP
jgi:RNA polymerase sigma factor (sigma-70 family)